MKQKIKILFAENEAMTAMWLCNHLKKFGYYVLMPVRSGKDAVKKADEENPDIIFMDIRLAGPMDGIEASQEILMRHKIPIVFVTGFFSEAVMERAKKLNPAAYLVKPVEPQHIIDVIESLFPDQGGGRRTCP